MKVSLIAEKVIFLVQRHTFLTPASVKLSSWLVVDLELDELDLVELVMAVEEEFDLEIEDEQWEQQNTVQDVVNLVVLLTLL